jgi:succinate dehydrogenase hydrophobic anchor subunit
MQNGFIKFIDLTLVIGVLYHAGYGLTAITRDYLSSRLLQASLAYLIFLVIAVFAWVGIKLIFLI